MGFPASKDPKTDPASSEPATPKIDDKTTVISDVVFARDPSIIDPTTGTVDQLEAFQHHNYLDVKSLVKQRELLADEESSPRARAAMRLLRKSPMNRD